MAGEVYSVVAAAEASEPLARGLYTLEQAEGSPDAALVPVLGSKRLVLPRCATSVREDGDLDVRASGYRLRLRAVGRSRLSPTEWEDLRARFTGRSAEISRLPAGSAQQVTVQEIELLRGGAILRYRERGRALSSLQLSASAFAAFRKIEGALEVRTAQGTGLRIRLRDCARCAVRLDNVRATEIEGLEYCPKCALHIGRQVRSAAQKRVGVCKGCMYYGISSGAGPRVGVCLNQNRLKALGPLGEQPVLRCVYRRTRPAGVARRKVDPEP